jgi:polyisoprenoid-binding protein YceI
LAGCYTPPQISPLAAPDGDYVLDPAHASLVWSVKHAGLSNYTARFDSISGALTFDSENPENSRVDIIIDPLSVSTGDSEFDDEIATKSSYFDTGSHPQIRFVSTNIVTTGENTGKITGDLTFRGTTLPVVLETVFNGAGKSFGHKGKTLGFSARAKFNRSDFGMNNLINFGIGDEVSIVIETEFNEK